MNEYYFITHNNEVLGMTCSFKDALGIFHDFQKCLDSGLLTMSEVKFSRRGYVVDTELLFEKNLNLK